MRRVVAGPRETKKQMLLYTVVLWPVSLSPWLLGLAGPVYAVSVGVLSLAFTGTAVAVWRDRTDRSARHMFAFSLLYLFLIFTVLLADHQEQVEQRDRKNTRLNSSHANISYAVFC